MAITQIKRGATTAIPFTISDATGNLANKRVTWAVADAIGNEILSKKSAQPGSSVDVTISAQSSTSIAGTINLTPADFAELGENQYRFTLWVDDSGGAQLCATSDGFDTLEIIQTVARF